MMNNKKSSESGQAIVLLVVSIVVLLGFTALAIDGGMIYSDRRQAKNAADTAALTGMAEVASHLQSAGIRYQNWDCGAILTLAETYAPASAIYRAQTNGYSLDPGFDDDGVDIICNNFDTIPVANRTVDIYTAVRSEVQTSFAQVLTSSPLQNYVESAATLLAPPPFGSGFALLALNTDSCSGNSNGLIFGGSAVVEIEEGSAFTNCCLNGNGRRVQVTTGGGGVYYYDTDLVDCGMDAGTFPERLDNPLPATSQYPKPFLELPDDLSARCDEIGPGQFDGSVYTPGYYDSPIIINAGDTIEMERGLYCLRDTPSAFRVNGGANLTAYGVTLYVENGGVTVDGTATVTMGAPCSDLDNIDRGSEECSPTDVEGEYPYPALPHIMIFLAEGNESTVILSGTNETVFMGTIYAPDGDVVITGHGQTWTWETQIVANNIIVEGTPTLNIEFDNDNAYQFGLRLSTLQ
jgi:Flp pilus assembly protein TadG